MPIRCEIVSQDRIVFQDDVDIVVLPGAEGEMGILPHHSPVLSVLQFGVITVRKGGEEPSSETVPRSVSWPARSRAKT